MITIVLIGFCLFLGFTLGWLLKPQTVEYVKPKPGKWSMQVIPPRNNVEYFSNGAKIDGNNFVVVELVHPKHEYVICAIVKANNDNFEEKLHDAALKAEAKAAALNSYILE
jgi:hypothetical protein